MNRRTKPSRVSAVSSSFERELAEALRCHQAGELQIAEDGYRRILQRKPDHHEALHLLGVLMHQCGHPDMAQQLVQAAIKFDGSNDTYYFNLGEIQRATGQASLAIQSYQQALSIEPREADYLFGLGTALNEVGDGDAAIPVFRQALEFAPDDPQIHNNLGNALAAIGDLDSAMQQFQQAIACDADYAEARVNLGSLHKQKGDFELAIASYRQAIELQPNHADIHYNLALVLDECGDQVEALGEYRKAIELNPEMSQAHANQGRLLREMDELDGAEQSYRLALDIDPQLPIALSGLAAVQRDRGDYRAACECYRRLLEVNPDDVIARSLLGDCLAKQDLYDQALEQFDLALGTDSSIADVHFNRGICLQAMGRFSEALVSHRQALVLNSQLAEAAYNLMLIDSHSMSGRELEKLAQQTNAENLDVQTAINLHFALAKAFKDRKRHDEAFAQLRAGNDIKGQMNPFRPEVYADYVERVIDTFDGEFFERHHGFGTDSEMPVFIVGMPRSGSTLVEQIISSHQQAFGAGELNDMRILSRQLPQLVNTGQDEPECVDAMPRELAKQLADDHLAKLHELSAGADRVCDKMLGNFLKLGLIYLLFPRARIIHCQRHPLDMGLSCYFQNFARGLRFSYRLEHLGCAYRGYHRVMEHWRKVLPLRMLEVRYERLISDQEQVSRELIEFCDLDWDPRCLDFHHHSRGVKTASFWQVRQPLYSSSVGQWRDYRQHLAPLIEVLGDLLDDPLDE